MLDYTYTKYKDVHTITNNSAETLGYTVSKVICEDILEEKSYILLPGATATLSFKVDGVYSIYPYDTDENGTPFIIKTYKYLQDSFLQVAEKLLCNCAKCSDCEECDSCTDFMDAYAKAISYNILLDSKFTALFTSITNFYQCEFSQQVNCAILSERVLGNTDTREMLKKVIEWWYYTFYYTEILEAIDAEEEMYIKNKYKCILKIKTQYKEIEEVVEEENVLVYYWQETENTTIQQVKDLLTAGGQTLLDSKGNVLYADVDINLGGSIDLILNVQKGGLVFCIQPVLNTMYLIYDTLGVDVTFQFDNYYDPTLNAAVFLAKESFAVVTNMTFSFRKAL